MEVLLSRGRLSGNRSRNCLMALKNNASVFLLLSGRIQNIHCAATRSQHWHCGTDLAHRFQHRNHPQIVLRIGCQAQLKLVPTAVEFSKSHRRKWMVKQRLVWENAGVHESAYCTPIGPVHSKCQLWDGEAWLVQVVELHATCAAAFYNRFLNL